ncbi:MAG: hypothetical protein KatS3mg015_1553 [Fimbriimonadales bacterium]|nr:MAG: hypothetical protein KatS3mg015_1553 [Fimbriimonadales bacterium]
MIIVALIPILTTGVLLICLGIYTTRALKEAKTRRDRILGSLQAWKSELQGEDTRIVGDNWPPLARRDSHNDIVTTAIRTVFANRDREPDLEALATVLSQGEASQLIHARSAPNFMFLSGLAGTLIGIMIAVWGLGAVSAQNSSNASNVTPEISTVLQTIPMAFFATLTGIFCALAYAYKINEALRDQSDLLAKVQEFILTEVAPRVIPPKTDTAAVKLNESVIELGKVITQLPVQLEQVSQGLTDSTVRAAAEISGALEVARTITAETRNAAQQIAAASDALQTSARTLEQTHHQLSNLHEAMLREFEATRERIDRSAELTIHALRETTQQNLEGLNSAADAIRDVGTRTTSDIQSMLNAMSELRHSVTQLIEVSKEEADNLWQNIGGRFNQSLDAHREVATQYAEALKDVEVNLEQGLSGIRTAFDELMRRLDPRLWPEDQWRDVREAISALTPALEELRSQLQSLQGAQGALDELKGTIGQLNQTLSSLGNLPHKMDEQLNRLNVLHQIEHLLRTMNENLRNMRNQQAASTQRTDGGGNPAQIQSGTQGNPPKKKRRWWPTPEWFRRR